MIYDIYDMIYMHIYMIQVQEMMDQADKDGTNSLDIIEFLQELQFSLFSCKSFFLHIYRFFSESIIITSSNVMMVDIAIVFVAQLINNSLLKITIYS